MNARALFSFYEVRKKKGCDFIKFFMGFQNANVLTGDPPYFHIQISGNGGENKKIALTSKQ